MSALHPSSTLLTPAYMNAKGNPFHLGRRKLGLILSFYPRLQYSASASAIVGQHRLYCLVDDFRNGTTAGVTILAARLPAWFLRMGFGFAVAEGIAREGLGWFMGATG